MNSAEDRSGCHRCYFARRILLKLSRARKARKTAPAWLLPPPARRCWSAPGRCARAGNEDVNEAAGAWLPAGERSGVKDAHEGADEVVGFGVGAEIAAGDGAPHGGDEGGVNERAGAFDEAHGTARDGVHCGDDKPFFRHVIDEEQHPGTERFEGRQSVGEALFCSGKLLDFVAVDRFDERVAGREVAIERAWADAGLASDI